MHYCLLEARNRFLHHSGYLSLYEWHTVGIVVCIWASVATAKCVFCWCRLPWTKIVLSSPTSGMDSSIMLF